jgi:transposase-like protein
MSEKKQYRRFDSASKIHALQLHMMKKKPVSEICQELGIQPSVFYSWQSELFSRGASVFEKKPGPRVVDRSAEQISALESKLAKKDSVIAELLQEHVDLKKKLGVN